MSLQVWLPLNGDLHDQGLLGITATNNGATLNDNGKIGKCYNFTGSNSISINTVVLPSQTSAWSFACWFNLSDVTTTTAECLFSERGGGGNANGYTIFLYPSSGQILVDDGTRWSTTPMTYTANTWYHLAVTRNASGKKLYINGQLKSQTTTVGNTTAINNNGCLIGLAQSGSSLTSGNQGWKGKLNDVRIYTHALSAKEVEEISRGLVLHYKLDTLDLYGSGNPNLATCSTAEQRLTAASNNNYCYFWINSSTLEPNTTYTFSAEVEVSDDITKCTIYNYTSSGNSGSIYHNFPADGQRHSWTFTTTSTGLGLIGYAGNSGQTAGHSAIYRNIKIELGSVATPYIPRETEMGETNFNTIYDCSGYNHIGLINNVSAINDTQRYGKSMSFSGSTSYVKVNDNTWMAQHAETMTINLWVKNSSWATNTHFFSCTESGGFNTEPGNSGYLRFPIYVCTNAGQTSYAYKYDSKELQISAIPTNEWVMLTWVYDNTGTRTYINGQLHHTYTNTSYGIRFNMNARLFLGCEASTANPTTPYYNGQESDFRLYYTALTQEQILELYNTSMTIDKNGNGYAREVIEDMGLNVTKTGQFHGYEMLDDNTFTTASITKLNKQLKVNTLYEY